MTEKYQDCSTVQGLLSRIIGFFFTSHSRNPAGEGPVGGVPCRLAEFENVPFRSLVDALLGCGKLNENSVPLLYFGYECVIRKAYCFTTDSYRFVFFLVFKCADKECQTTFRCRLFSVFT